jgi:hypothetical protein
MVERVKKLPREARQAARTASAWSDYDLEELERRSAGGKIGEQQVLNDAVVIGSLKRGLSRLRSQNRSASDIRR